MHEMYLISIGDVIVMNLQVERLMTVLPALHPDTCPMVLPETCTAQSQNMAKASGCYSEKAGIDSTLLWVNDLYIK